MKRLLLLVKLLISAEALHLKVQPRATLPAMLCSESAAVWTLIKQEAALASKVPGRSPCGFSLFLWMALQLRWRR